MQFCYIDVANITKIIKIAKAVNANWRIFNVNTPFLTFVTILTPNRLSCNEFLSFIFDFVAF